MSLLHGSRVRSRRRRDGQDDAGAVVPKQLDRNLLLLPTGRCGRPIWKDGSQTGGQLYDARR